MHAELQLIAGGKRPHSKLENLSPVVERNWFEFDRDAVLRELDDLRKAIAVNAKELGMVAVEGVFEPPLAGDLHRTSRSLQAVARQISNLWNEVSHASGYPKRSTKKPR